MFKSVKSLFRRWIVGERLEEFTVFGTYHFSDMSTTFPIRITVWARDEKEALFLASGTVDARGYTEVTNVVKRER